MADPAFTAEQQTILNVVFRSFNDQIADLRNSLYRTRRDLIALAGLISSKGISIDEEEWKEAGRAIEVAHQVDLVFDPRAKRGEEFLRRILSGEDIPDDEMNRWLRDVGEDDDL